MKITIEIDNQKLIDRILNFCASLNIQNVKLSEGKTERMQRNHIIMKELKAQLSENIPIVKLILFGSQVYGEPHAASDYDVLLVLEEEYDYETRRKVRF
ncbi:MAG: nucleotidyltransferase domain-containing protein [Bacteroidota bacterium]